jgi:hypothetical protein
LRRGMTIALVASVALSALAGLPAPTRAGELDRPEITDYRVWKPNRCYKPRPPSVQVTDALTFNLAVEAFNRYLTDMKGYLECAGTEANEDYAAIKQVLEESLGRLREDAIGELEATRNNIERYRALYAEPSMSAENPERR